jgi:hypothetical protein
MFKSFHSVFETFIQYLHHFALLRCFPSVRIEGLHIEDFSVSLGDVVVTGEIFLLCGEFWDVHVDLDVKKMRKALIARIMIT